MKKSFVLIFLFLSVFFVACSNNLPEPSLEISAIATQTARPTYTSDISVATVTPTIDDAQLKRENVRKTANAEATGTEAVKATQRNSLGTARALSPTTTKNIQTTPEPTTIFKTRNNLESPLPGIGTPYTQSDEIITEQNLSSLTELAKWGKGFIFDVAFSADGKWLGAATATGVYLYDTNTWESEIAFNYPDMVTSIAFSSDGKQLAIGFYSGFVQVIDIDTKQVFQEFETDYSPSQFEYLENDNYLLSTSNYIHPKLWSFETNEFVDLNDLVNGGAEFVVPAVKGETFATVIGAELRLWDLETETFSHTFPTDLDAYDIYGVAKANDYFALGLWHGDLEFRDLDTGQLLWESSAFCEKCFSPFNFDDHSPKCEYGHYDVQPPEYINLQFSSDEKYLITNFLGRIQWRDVSNGKVVRQYESRTDVAFSPDTDMMAWATPDGVIKVERISDGQEITILDDYFTSRLYYAEFTPNGKQVLIKDAHAFRFRMVDDGRLFRSLSVNDLDITPDGSLIALGYQDGLIEIKRNSDLSLMTTFRREANPVTQVEFSAQGNQLFSVHDCVVYATDTQNWSNLYSIIGLYGPALISTTPDEEQLLFEQNGLDLYQLNDGQWIENRDSNVTINKNEMSYALDVTALLKADVVCCAELNQDFGTLKTDTPNSSFIVLPAPNGWSEAIPNPLHLEKFR